jgi:hypothetical protein
MANKINKNNNNNNKKKKGEHPCKKKAYIITKINNL